MSDPPPTPPQLNAQLEEIRRAHQAKYHQTQMAQQATAASSVASATPSTTQTFPNVWPHSASSPCPSHSESVVDNPSVPRYPSIYPSPSLNHPHIPTGETTHPTSQSCPSIPNSDEWVRVEAEGHDPHDHSASTTRPSAWGSYAAQLIKDEEFARKLQEEEDAMSGATVATNTASDVQPTHAAPLHRAPYVSPPHIHPTAPPDAAHSTSSFVNSIVTPTGPSADVLAQLAADEAFARSLQERDDAPMDIDEALARRLQAIEEADDEGNIGQEPPRPERLIDPMPEAPMPSVGNVLSMFSASGNAAPLNMQWLLARQRGEGPPVPPQTGPFPLDQFLQQLLGLRMSTGDNAASYEELLRLQERLGFVNRGATRENIENLPTYKYTSTTPKTDVGLSASCSGQNDHVGDGQCRCAICLDDYDSGVTLRTLPCLHHFHRDCIDTWLKQNKQCPVCKTAIC